MLGSGEPTGVPCTMCDAYGMWAMHWGVSHTPIHGMETNSAPVRGASVPALSLNLLEMLSLNRTNVKYQSLPVFLALALLALPTVDLHT